MTVRLDMLKECNDQGVTLQDFTGTFCNRCVQPECTRSQFGTSKFDYRAATWVQRLFTEVPRMDPSDPRFKMINEKHFRTLRVEKVPTILGGSSWLDPKDIKETAPAVIAPAVIAPAVIAPAPEPPPVVAELVEEEIQRVVEEPTIEPVEEPVALVNPAPRPQVSPPTTSQVLMNTPVQPRRMLAGAPAPEVKKDLWSSPPDRVQSPSTEVVVKKGATIRLGRG